MKIIANKEEQEIQKLITIIIEKQIKKIEIKLDQFEKLEKLLFQEKKQVKFF